MSLRNSALFVLPLLLALPAFPQNARPLPAATPAAAGFSTERLERLHQNLDRSVDDGSHAGYILLLARDGKIVDWRAHGFTNAVTKTPIQKDSIVRLFSMTKLVTSTAVLQLVEEGRLKLTDRIDQYLPALKNPKVFTGGTADAPVLEDARAPITVRDLLTHTSGYFYNFNAPAELITLQKRANLWAAPNLTEFVARLGTVPLADHPGTAFRYGVSTDVLGALVEKVSGQSLDAFFQERILGPLGMVDTSFWVPAEKRARIARIHTPDSGGKLMLDTLENSDERCGADHGLRMGGAGLYSTAGDYARFAQMLLNGGQLDGTRILGRKTVELMTQNHLSGLAAPHPFGNREQGFGLGVRVITDLGQSPTLGSAGSFGWDGYATTTVLIDPRERTVALLLYQHLPYNEGDVFTLFTNGWYSALEN
jgi:CubicO group peptidase (beta-lactamase class C family)